MKITSTALYILAIATFSVVPPTAHGWLSGAAAALQVLAKVRDFEQVAISPDGTQVAWVELLHETNNAPSRNTTIYCIARTRSAAEPNRISVVNGRNAKEHKISWAP